MQKILMVLTRPSRSLIEDVILYAFKQTGLPDSAFDLINLQNDEPVTYDYSVKYEQKLLIGKSRKISSGCIKKIMSITLA